MGEHGSRTLSTAETLLQWRNGQKKKKNREKREKKEKLENQVRAVSPHALNFLSTGPTCLMPLSLALLAFELCRGERVGNLRVKGGGGYMGDGKRDFGKQASQGGGKQDKILGIFMEHCILICCYGKSTKMWELLTKGRRTNCGH